MTERFEVGEVAIYVRPGSPLYGIEVTITSRLTEFSGGMDHITGKRYDVMVGYTFQCGFIGPSGSDFWVAKPKWLRKKKPPALDKECYRVTSWNDGVWAPKEVEVTEG